MNTGEHIAMGTQLRGNTSGRLFDDGADAAQRTAVDATRIRAAFWVQKYATIITFICGIYLNLALIFFGQDLTFRYVFTLSVDRFLLTNMIISTVLGWYVLRYVRFTSAGARRFQIVILSYFVMLCLVHGIVIQILRNISLYINTFLRIPGYP